MISPLKIRDAIPEEARDISDLALRSKAVWGYSAEFMAVCRDELAVTAKDLKSAQLNHFVAERDSEMLGFYAIKKCSETDYELEALFVEPAHMGTGVGKSLLHHAKTIVQTMGGRALIIQSDPNAEGFYKAAGAELIGTRKSESIADRSLPLFRIGLCREDAT